LNNSIILGNQGILRSNGNFDHNPQTTHEETRNIFARPFSDFQKNGFAKKLCPLSGTLALISNNDRGGNCVDSDWGIDKYVY